MLSLSSVDFFKINFFSDNISGIPSECQTIWIQIRPDVLSGLIWVQTVCKGYQQTTKVATIAGKELRRFQQSFSRSATVYGCGRELNHVNAHF